MTPETRPEKYPRLRFPLRLLASGLFVSYLPVYLTGGKKFSGAGLLGSILAVALLPLLPASGEAYTVFLVPFCIFSVWVADSVRFENGVHDDPRIVIDEIAGMWTAAAFLPRTGWIMLAALALFRLLDSAKPFGIRRAENLPGGLGVVMDDLVCGVAANLLVHLGLLLGSNNFRINI
jgi:phosphatidylglycerophosphatase A